MKSIIICFLTILYGSVFCSAQQTVPAAGGDATGTGGEMSYTVGQVICSEITETEGSVMQGVQLPYEIFIIHNSEDNYEICIELSVYPNPVGDRLRLIVVNGTSGNLTYQLFDVNGKLLENKKLDYIETEIPTDMLAPSVYLLKVTDNMKEVKTFKIIKN
jgi:hypothetical protein